MATIAHFRQHYADLHDEELIQIALTRELVAEAQQALTDELSKRGISDLSSYKASMEQEALAEEEERKKKIAHHTKSSGWGTKIAYIVGLATLLYGTYRVFVPSTTSPGDDVGIVVGLGIIILAWLKSVLGRFWVKHVLYRKPSR